MMPGPITFATLADWAALSLAAYNDTSPSHVRGRLPPNWIYVEPEELGGITVDIYGYFNALNNAAFVVKNAQTGMFGIVFRGTEDTADLVVSDFALFIGLGSVLLNDFSSLINAVITNLPAGYSLFTTGHSLGGFLAERLVYESTAFETGAAFGSPGIGLLPFASSNPDFVHVARTRDAIGTYLSGSHQGTTLLIDENTFSQSVGGLSHSIVYYRADMLQLSQTDAFRNVDVREMDNLYFSAQGSAFQGNLATSPTLAAHFAFMGTGFDDQFNGAARTDFLRIDGGAGNDTIIGGSAGDVLAGGSGNDIIHGNYGNDTLYGGNNDDMLYGDQGSDSMSGGNGNDLLYGGQGEDFLRGGSGDDYFSGGRGDDHYSIGLSEGADVIDEAGDGNGTDTINLYVGSTFNAFDFGWFSRDGNDLLIRANNGSGSRVIDMRIVGAGSATNAVENVDLFVGDATTASQSWSLANIWQQLTGAPPSGGSSSNPGGSGGTVVGGNSNGFSDDFNRSDGTIGNGWVANAASGSNSLQILNGRVTATPIANVGQTTQMLHAADFSSNVRVTADLFGTFDPATGLNNQYLTSIFFGGTGSLTNSLGIEIRSQGSVASGAQISLYRGNGTGNGPGTIIFTHAPLASQIHVDVGYTAEGAIIGSITSGGQRFEFNFEAGFARPSGNNIVISQSIPAGISTPAIDNVSITNGALPGIDLNEQTYARSLAINATLTGTINAPWDKDWFAVDLVAGTAYRFQLRGADSGGGTLADPFLRVRDANGNPIVYNGDSGPDGRDSLLFYVAPTTGRYYLSVGGDLVSGGTYAVGVMNASTANGVGLLGDRFSNNLIGGDGSDHLNGDGGNDYIVGGNGNDQITDDDVSGPFGNDVLFGNDGDDRFQSGGGSDRIDGGEGRDFLYLIRPNSVVGLTYVADDAASAIGLNLADGTFIANIESANIIFGAGNDIVSLHIGSRPGVEEGVGVGGGNDVVTVGGGMVTVSGGEGIDKLIVDFRWAMGSVYQLPPEFGSLRIWASDNNSINWVGFEELVFYGGSAGDTIQAATAGNDQLYGYGGNDSLSSGAGNDQLFGGDGDDQLNPGTGIDEVDGGSGNDRLVLDRSSITGNINLNVDAMRTEAGVTLLDGTQVRSIESIDVTLGSGNDTVATLVNSVAPITNFGGSGLVDRIICGAGDDQITIGGGSDYVDGGAGVDTVIMDFRWSERPIEGSGSPPPFAAFGFRDNYGSNITTANVESFIIYGGSGNDNVTLGMGNGSAFGGLGDDTLRGQGGNDLLNGGTGSDLLDGGDGFDMASYEDSVVAVNINLSTNSYSGGDADGDTLIGIEAIIGSAFADSLIGNGGDNVLDGGGGGDALYGDAGNDRLILGGGAAGAIIDGGVGTDTLVVTASTTLASIAGIEALELAGGANLILTGTQFSTGLARNTAVSGNGAITVNMDVGTPLVSTPFAFAGTDVSFVVNGTSGFDIIKLGNSNGNVANGGDGVDQIRGGQLADTINGGNDNDKIMGSGGADILTGGAGNDQFRYLLATDSGPGANADRITDFTIGSDRLNLTAIDTNPLVDGVQGFAFIGDAAFAATGTAQVRYGNSGADLLVQADVNGDGIADMEIIMQGNAGQMLSAADFMMATTSAEQPVFKDGDVMDIAAIFADNSAHIDIPGFGFADHLIFADQMIDRFRPLYIDHLFV